MKTLSQLPAGPDAELLGLARTGDRDAFGHLVARHQSLVCAIAYAICGDFARSQDLAQEAFVAAWRQLGQLDDPSRFKAWISGIVRNLARGFVRQRARHRDLAPEPLDAAPEPASDAPGPREHAVSAEEAALVWKTLEQLPENYREPLVLFYREHQSVQNVAAALELSEDTTKQRLSRGRDLLRAEVERVISRSLGCTTPGVLFTTSVLGALPAVAPQLIATGLAGTAAKGSAAIKTATGLSLGGAALGSVFGLLGAWLGHRAAIQQTRTPEERAFVGRMLRDLWTIIIGANLILVAALVWQRGWIAAHPREFALLLFGWILAFGAALGLLAMWGVRRHRAFAAKAGLPPPGESRIGAIRYRSPAEFLGLPLIHISLGGSPEDGSRRGVARAWIAVGDVAWGVFLALGGVAGGGIALGGVSIGLVSVGGIALGGIAFGGFGIGAVVVAGVAVGWWALGGAAIGHAFAAGGVAIARDHATGDIAVARLAGDPALLAWFATSPLGRALHWLRPALPELAVLPSIPALVYVWLRQRTLKARQ